MSNFILCLKTAVKNTRISVYSHREQLYLNTIRHTDEELSQFNSVNDQFAWRRDIVLKELEKGGFSLDRIGIIACKGGVIKPLDGGVYQINEAMIRDLARPMADHESNLGVMIAIEISRMDGQNIPAVIVEPSSVDELDDIARISGIPEISRKSLLHTLSQRSVAIDFARANGRNYEDINVIVAHMGTGITVGAHRHGRIVDVNNGLAGDGPMSPLRAGSLPVAQLIKLAYSGKFTYDQLMRRVCGNGGIRAYLGTSNALTIEQRIKEGDKEAELVYRAMAYQVAKEIASMSAVLMGQVDGIVLTGGLAYSRLLVDEITQRVLHLAEVVVYPGENEMKTLAASGYMVLNGEVQPKEYI
ncbi:MAG: butyrate kinase [Bacteroidales bacterium]